MATHTTLQRIKRGARRRGITQEQIAAKSGVKRQHVCHVLAGRYTSKKVVLAAKRLIAEYDAGQAMRKAGAA